MTPSHLTTLGRAIAVALATLAATLAAPAAASHLTAGPPAKAAAKAGPLKIMPLGDSITRGQGDGGTSGTYNGWRCSLRNRLTTSGVQVDYVGPLTDGRNAECPDREHAGWSGWTIAELDAEAAGWVATYQPDVVLLTAGTNDIIEKQDMTNMAARLGALIDTVKSAKPGVQIIVGTLPQIGTSSWCCDATQVAAWNAYKTAVPQVAAEHGARVMYFQRVYQSELAADKIHPGACAYGSKMAFLVFLAVIDLLRPEGFDPLWAPNSCGASG